MQPLTTAPLDPAHETSSRLMGFCSAKGSSAYLERGWPDISEEHWKDVMGLRLSSIGIGTYLGEEDDATDEKVIQGIVQAVNRGVNVIDTAINYRGQRGERSVGKAIQLALENGFTRKELFVCTKAGFVPADADTGKRSRETALMWCKHYDIPADQFIQEMHCMHPKYLEASLSHSLKNLWLDQIDLFYLHNTAEMQMPEIGKLEYMQRLRDAFQFMEQARRQGNIRYYGLATWNCFTTTANSQEHLELEEVVQIARSVGGEDHGMRFIQLPINPHMSQAFLTRSQTVNGRQMSLLAAARELGVHVMASRSISAGQGHEVEQVRKVFQKCKIPSRQMPSTPCAMALQLTRSLRGVTTALVGMKGSHVQEDLDVLRLERLDENLLAQCFEQIER